MSGARLSRAFEPLLAAFGDRWPAGWAQLARAALGRSAHGDLSAWLDAVARLAALAPADTRLELDDPPGTRTTLTPAAGAERDAALRALVPWRKGPVRVLDRTIRTEWRSDWKWARAHAALGPLAGQRVLDVGCGNGYYALRALAAGADSVLGVDPTLLFVTQYLALVAGAAPPPALVLPLRLEDLPAGGHFDLVCSLGVLTHRRDPHDHLRRLQAQLAPGGRLLLETIVVPGGAGDALVLDGRRERYARMGNVWRLPSVPTLIGWLHESGFEAIECFDTSLTRAAEQQSGTWMPFESLAEALDPDRPWRTIEGHPAPRRSLLLARPAR